MVAIDRVDSVSSKKQVARTQNAVFPASISVASRNEITNLNLEIQGNLPADLIGHIFILCPAGSVDSAKMEKNRDLVIPALENGISTLNGDGMIYRLDFEAGKIVSATTRLVKTPCYYLEKAIHENQDKLDRYSFQSIGLMRCSPHLGIRTQANTACSIVQFANDIHPRLLLTSDNGRPYEINPKTLELVTPIGSNKEWKEIKMPIANGPFKMIGSAAHPAFDERTKEFFTVNWSISISSMLAPIGLNLETLELLLKKLPIFLKKKHRKIKIAKYISNLKGIGSLIEPLTKKFFFKGEIANFFQPYVYPELLVALQEIEQELLSKNVGEIDLLLESVSGAIAENISVFKALKTMKDFVYLVRWDGKSALKSWQVLIDEANGLEPIKLENTLHQIGITEDYIILLTSYAG